MSLQRCTLCPNVEDPRWGLVIDDVRAPLCEGCSPMPASMDEIREVADRIREIRHEADTDHPVVATCLVERPDGRVLVIWNRGGAP